MSHILQKSLCVSFIAVASTGFAAGKATIKVSPHLDGNKTLLTFATIPGDGLKINGEGPWKLEIKSHKGFKPSNTEFKRPEWQEDVAGFQVPVTIEKGMKSGEVSYKMTTFVCTKDKSTCYREVVEGTEAFKF